MAAEYEMTLNDYVSILKRRSWLILLISSVIILISIVAAVVLPPVYQSTGTILVESQQISKDLVQSIDTSVASERIEVIKRRVMTRDNLYNIMRKYGLYQDQMNKKSVTYLVGEMRNNITVELVSATGANPWERSPTIAFTVSFEYGNPDIAHKVTNELVTLFLDENVKSRTEKATETTEFLSHEAEILRKELEATEAKVAAFKEKYAGALPEHMEMHMSLLERAQSDIKDVDRDYKSTQEELRYLDVELASAKSGIGTRNLSAETGTVVLSSAAELEKAKLELERAQAVYSDSHPTVKSLKRRIESLEKQVATDKSTSTSGNAEKSKFSNIETDLMVAKVQAKIDAAKARLESLSEQRAALRRKVDELASKISRSPEVEKGLFSLMRDYENAKDKYEEVKSKQINAKIAENLEQENKAERFTVLEPPVFPDKPTKPNRKKVVLMGVVAGFGAALGIVFLLEIINARVRGVEALEAITKVRTMVTLPYVQTQAEIKRKRHQYRYILIAIVILILLSVIVVHFFVMPLDMLFVKLLNRVM